MGVAIRSALKNPSTNQRADHTNHDVADQANATYDGNWRSIRR
jgi:hypothetical protein